MQILKVGYIHTDINAQLMAKLKSLEIDYIIHELYNEGDIVEIEAVVETLKQLLTAGIIDIDDYTESIECKADLLTLYNH